MPKTTKAQCKPTAPVTPRSTITQIDQAKLNEARVAPGDASPGGAAANLTYEPKVIEVPVIEGMDICDFALRMSKLLSGDRQKIVAALDAVSNDTGCTSPEEEFVSDILGAYDSGDLRPEAVEGWLSVFREDYEAMVVHAVRFMSRNKAGLEALRSQASAIQATWDACSQKVG
jgi:hypothetical protein